MVGVALGNGPVALCKIYFSRFHHLMLFKGVNRKVSLNEQVAVNISTKVRTGGRLKAHGRFTFEMYLLPLRPRNILLIELRRKECRAQPNDE